jgi:hypothetical protein
MMVVSIIAVVVLVKYTRNSMRGGFQRVHIVVPLSISPGTSLCLTTLQTTTD